MIITIFAESQMMWSLPCAYGRDHPSTSALDVMVGQYPCMRLPRGRLASSQGAFHFPLAERGKLVGEVTAWSSNVAMTK